VDRREPFLDPEQQTEHQPQPSAGHRTAAWRPNRRARQLAPRYHDTVLAVLGGTGEAFEVWENPLPGLRNLGVSLSRQGFMLLPASLTGHLPAGVRGLVVGDDLSTIDLALSWTVPASAAVRLLVDTAERMARAQGWPRPGRRPA